MRHGRAKQARRTLQFFQRTVGLRAPYHILLDGTFLVAVIKFKIPLRDRLDKVFQHEKFNLYATKKSMEELEKLKGAALQANKKDDGDLLQNALRWASEECEILEYAPPYEKEINDMLDSKYSGIEQTLSPAGHDILKLALASPSSRKTQYVVACQDEAILDILRNAGTVPCLRLARSVLLLENPSKAGQMQAGNEERKKWAMSGSVREEERLLVNVVKEELRKEQSTQFVPIELSRKKRKAKEPNPLSCKKPKKEEKGDTKRKRRRKKRGSDEG